MLQMFGVPVRREGLCCAVSGKAVLSPTRIKIPADPSSAAFFMVGSVIAPNSDLLLKEVCVNPTRNGVIELLRRMGAHIEMLNPRKMGSEPVADIRVVGGSLRGIDIVGAEVPAAIDDLPALFVAAATAHGKTRLTGASELRHKESDRIAAMADGLQRLGVGCETTEDGIVIEGRGDKKSVFSGGEVDSCGDHRIAMAFTMAALRAKDSVVVNDCDNVSTSFPGFGKMATAAGIRIAVSKD
jgi:3-phosphoshikimate 1-carboxyvinyltransferase